MGRQCGALIRLRTAQQSGGQAPAGVAALGSSNTWSFSSHPLPLLAWQKICKCAQAYMGQARILGRCADMGRMSAKQPCQGPFQSSEVLQVLQVPN